MNAITSTPLANRALIAVALQQLFEHDILDGEHYAGIVLDADGKPSHHLILLPGDGGGLNHAEATDWAAEAGGELPTSAEQALLYANLKSHFHTDDWYWSSTPYAAAPGRAWVQHFSYCCQHNYDVSGRCRARAVRRLPI